MKDGVFQTSLGNVRMYGICLNGKEVGVLFADQDKAFENYMRLQKLPLKSVVRICESPS
jgi:hypothetical protein